MPHISHDQSTGLASAVRASLGVEYGFVTLVVDLSDGMISVVSDAPDVPVVKSALETALKNIESATAFKLAVQPPNERN